MAKVSMKVDNGADGHSYEAMSYPGNSHKAKQDKAEAEAKKGRKNVKPVIRRAAKRKKPTLGSKFKETFVGEDIDNIGMYIIHDVVVPAIKNTLYDLTVGSMSMMLLGDARPRNLSRDKGRSHVSYSSYSKDSRPKYSTPNRRAMHKFDDIILENKGDAEAVLDHLVDLIIDYGQATVADLYDLVNISHDFPDSSYGWEDLSQAYVNRVRDGYLIVLPKVMEL